MVHVTAPMLAAYQHFISAGFIENGAGAAVGNFCQESGEMLIATMFRPHPDYSGGVPDALKSGGIAEWLGERKTAYIAFSGRAEVRLGLAKGSLINDLGTQCDFVVYELQTTPKYATLYQQLTSGSRSIQNLTANFMMVYEVPALATANLDNRIEHAEAVVKAAKALRAAPSPPAQQVPTPQAPAAPIQTPTAEPPAGSPPMPVSISGLDTAILDQFAAIRQALMAQRDAIILRISKIEEQATEFAKLEGIFTPPPISRISAANPAAQQRTKSMNVVTSNPWTSSAGIGALIGAGLSVYHSVSTGTPPDQAQVYMLFSSALTGIGLLFSKDWNKTGGTVPATPEAARRTGTPLA